MAKRKKRTYCITVYMDGGQACVFTYDKRTEDKEQIHFYNNNSCVARFYLSKIIGYKEIDITEEENEDAEI